MKANGRTKFCPGCPVADLYTGEIKNPKTNNEALFTWEEGSLGSNDIFLLIADKNGVESGAVRLDRSDFELTYQNKGLSDAEIGKELDEGMGRCERAVYEAIGECATGTVGQSLVCPGFNQTLVTNMMKYDKKD